MHSVRHSSLQLEPVVALIPIGSNSASTQLVVPLTVSLSDTLPLPVTPFGRSSRWIRCHARLVIMTLLGLLIVSLFWFGSRYPALLTKAHHTSDSLASMAYSHEVFQTSGHNSVLLRILFGSLNWLNSMAIGMTFGLSFGALLHTILRYYPLRISQNLTLNTLSGALVGVPMGVCANCAVPMACGLTRGQGRIEVALGYLFSSPNFNPVVIAITFSILPWYFGAVKYAVLLLVILVLVPRLIQHLEARGGLRSIKHNVAALSCSLDFSLQPCEKPFVESAREVLADYAKHFWMLLKPTISLMLLASILASALLVLIPWKTFLSVTGVGRMLVASLLGVVMPVPIALDVMFAGELHRTGINAGYTMMFLMTLGTYSVIPATYLWREVSRTLALGLFVFFLIAGAGLGLVFSAIG